MTQLAFHFGAPDKLAYACRLLRKAVGTGARVVVVADAYSVQRLDSDLWALAATDFLAHCTEEADAAVLQRSAVVLVQQLGADLPHHDVLVNLSDAIPDGFKDFERVIEVVSTDDADRNLARGRWKQYVEMGYAITRHDLTLKGAS